MSSQEDVKDHECEVSRAMDRFELLIHDHYNGSESEKDEADEGARHRLSRPESVGRGLMNTNCQHCGNPSHEPL